MVVDPDDSAPPDSRVGTQGVMLIRGGQLRLSNLSLTIGEDGQVTAAPVEVQLSWDIWPLWLRVAIEHEATAAMSRAELLSADGPENDERRAALLEDETRAGMVTVTAAAFTLEAMALSAASKAGVSGVGSESTAATRVAEVLKQTFEIKPDLFMTWRDQVKMLFKARNEAVHADAGFHDPLPHPALRAGVVRPAHVYRLENARGAVEIALWTALTLSPAPRPRLGRKFREATAPWAKAAEDLRDLRRKLAGEPNPNS